MANITLSAKQQLSATHNNMNLVEKRKAETSPSTLNIDKNIKSFKQDYGIGNYHRNPGKFKPNIPKRRTAAVPAQVSNQVPITKAKLTTKHNNNQNVKAVTPINKGDSNIEQKVKQTAPSQQAKEQIPAQTANTIEPTPEKGDNALTNESQKEDIIPDDLLSETSSIASSSGKKESIPPIVIEDLSAKKIIEIFKSRSLAIDFVIKNVNKDKCIIKAKSLNAYNYTLAALKQLNIESYTFTQRHLKPRSLVLKGLNFDTSADEVLEGLEGLNVEGVTFVKVNELKSAKNKSKIYIVQVTADSIVRNIYQINNLLYQSIRWEPLRKTQTVQCKNCQRLGHISSCCNRQYRCVKCTESHQPGECQIVRGDRANLQCVLCNEKGHPASYKGCRYIVEFNKRRSPRSKKRSVNAFSQGSKNNKLYSEVTDFQNNQMYLPPVVDCSMQSIFQEPSDLSQAPTQGGGLFM